MVLLWHTHKHKDTHTQAASCQRKAGNKIEFWCSLRAVLIHFHTVWLTAEVVLKGTTFIQPPIWWLISPEPRWDARRRAEKSLSFFSFICFLHATSSLPSKQQWKHDSGNGGFSPEKFLLGTKNMVCQLVCFSSIHLRWHSSWISLNVWLIALQDQERRHWWERSYRECHIFKTPSLWAESKMNTGTSALVHWAASSFLHFLFNSEGPESLSVFTFSLS